MLTSEQLIEVRLLNDFDPYNTTADNRPLTDLAERDLFLANQLDKKVAVLGVNLSGSIAYNRGFYHLTSSKTATGVYQIAGDFSDLLYSVLITVEIPGTTPVFSGYKSKTLTGFEIRLFDSSMAPVDAAFSVMVST